jgi:hypothetical protein
VAPAVLGAAGLGTIVVGTFLPWLRSGRGLHNSYQTDGTMQRLLHLRGATSSALDAWPFVGVVCALVVAAYAFGLTRLAVLGATLIALITGAVAVGTLRVTGASFARPATLGPRVTTFGAIVVLVAATLLLFARREAAKDSRRRR